MAAGVRQRARAGVDRAGRACCRWCSLVGAIVWQLALAGHAAWLTANAARAGARADIVGRDATARPRAARCRARSSAGSRWTACATAACASRCGSRSSCTGWRGRCAWRRSRRWGRGEAVSTRRLAGAAARRRWRRVALVPLLLASASGVLQLLAVGYASVLAGSAAEAGALALAGGGDARARRAAALPGWSEATREDRVEGGQRRGPPAPTVAAAAHSAERLEVERPRRRRCEAARERLAARPARHRARRRRRLAARARRAGSRARALRARAAAARRRGVRAGAGLRGDRRSACARRRAGQPRRPGRGRRALRGAGRRHPACHARGQPGWHGSSPRSRARTRAPSGGSASSGEPSAAHSRTPPATSRRWCSTPARPRSAACRPRWPTRWSSSAALDRARPRRRRRRLPRAPRATSRSSSSTGSGERDL